MKPDFFKNVFFITVTLKDHEMFMLLSMNAQCQWIKWITGLLVLVHCQILNYQSGFILLYPHGNGFVRIYLRPKNVFYSK